MWDGYGRLGHLGLDPGKAVPLDELLHHAVIDSREDSVRHPRRR